MDALPASEHVLHDGQEPAHIGAEGLMDQVRQTIEKNKDITETRQIAVGGERREVVAAIEARRLELERERPRRRVAAAAAAARQHKVVPLRGPQLARLLGAAGEHLGRRRELELGLLTRRMCGMPL